MNFSRSQWSFPKIERPIEDEQTGNSLSPAIIISVLIHILFLWVLAAQRFTIEPEIFEIELTTLPEPKNKTASAPQIVSPPEKTVEEPKNPSFRSDVDSNTVVEQIKRGDGIDAGIPNPRSETNLSKAAPEQQDIEPPKKALEKKVVTKPENSAKEKAEQKTDASAIKEAQAPTQLKQLALDSNTLLEKFSKSPPVSEQKPSQARIIEPSRYQAFSRPPGSGARFIGQQGSNDYLPNLPDGDITLLNTKADQFAVFVRRVATQVFSEIRNVGWEVLSSGDINSASQFSTFRAILSLKGELLKVEQISSSGSTRLDNVIGSAVKKGSRDQNPPAAAAAPDGNIHFIFQARSWSQVVGSPRTGAPVERRWLLLATGLE
jgi:hypothetical protein